MPRKPEPLPDSFDPLEIALDAERGDTSPDSPARRLIIKQARLIDRQIADASMGTVLKALTGLAGLVVAGSLGAMAWSASQAKGLVIEAFSVPPDLAARGITGQVVASRLLDKLIAIPRTANSIRLAASFKSGWIDDIKVEIPQTGVSIGELERYLRRWLGHETVVSGEITRAAGGNLVVTVRADGQPGTDLTGPEAGLDGLLQQSAERVYGQAQPYVYAIYLNASGRSAESRTALLKLAETGPRGERAWALSGLSSTAPSAGDDRLAIDYARRAHLLDPGLPSALANQSAGELGLGHEERSLALERQARPLYASPRMTRELVTSARLTVGQILNRNIARFTGDYGAALTADAALGEMDSYSSSREDAPGDTAFDLASRHEPGAAAIAFAAGPAPNGRPDLQGWQYSPREIAWSVQIAEAVALDDWAQVLGNARDMDAWFAAHGPYGPSRLAPFSRPWLALGLARTGRLDEARAIAAALPTDCYFCLRVRAQVAALSGDPASADRWFAEAVRQGPSLPFADAEWGQTLMARGDLAGALAHFRAAAARGPRWADPLELWGEALLRQGDARGAEAKFKAADAFASRWGRNHLRWGEALMRQGKAVEAQAQWRMAAGLDLSQADRARVQSLLHGGR